MFSFHVEPSKVLMYTRGNCVLPLKNLLETEREEAHKAGMYFVNYWCDLVSQKELGFVAVSNLCRCSTIF